MKTSLSRVMRPLPLLGAMAVILLPGCADFWRVRRPVMKVAAEAPEPALPPSRPVPPEADPEPPLVKPAPGPRPTAIPVPGKDGYVFSPYNNKVIDVKGFAPGTLVADPTYPMSERKYFRVP